MRKFFVLLVFLGVPFVLGAGYWDCQDERCTFRRFPSYLGNTTVSAGYGLVNAGTPVNIVLTVDNSTVCTVSNGLCASGGGAYNASYLVRTGDTATGNYTFDSGTLFIDSTNNLVGIGTVSPGELLEVAGNINSTGGDICITGGNCLSSVGGTTPGGSSSEVQFNDGGSFGGDTSFVWDKVGQVLTLVSPAGTSNALVLNSGSFGSGEYNAIQFQNLGVNRSSVRGYNIGSSNYGVGLFPHRSGVGEVQALIASGNGVAGRVGIATSDTNPDATLEIGGSGGEDRFIVSVGNDRKVVINQFATISSVTPTATPAYASFGAIGENDTSSRFVFGFDIGNPFLGLGNGSASRDVHLEREAGDLAFQFGTSKTESFRMTSGGSLGIGTSTPSATLDVAGSVEISTLGAATSTQLCINATNGVSTCTSSRRYKEDIRNITIDVRDAVNALQPVTFVWKGGNRTNITETIPVLDENGTITGYENVTMPLPTDDFARRHVGFIAEDVELVASAYPNISVTFKNSKGEVEGVDYQAMVTILTKNVQDLNAENELLKAAVIKLCQASLGVCA